MLLVSSTASDPVSLPLVLWLQLLLLLRLPLYLPRWVFSAPAIVVPPVFVLVPNNFYELAVLLQQFINLRLLLVYLGLLFSDYLQQVVVLSCHLLYVLFVGRCRYRYFAEIVC